jgi:hypothetical protein
LSQLRRRAELAQTSTFPDGSSTVSGRAP